MTLFVKFWGTRGSIPTPGYRTQRYGGNTACVEVRCDDTVIICDAGSGIRELGAEMVRRAGGAPINAHLLISHTHWDHIQGFPFFTPAYLPGTTMQVYGASHADRSAYQLLTGQMDSAHFPTKFSDANARLIACDFEDGRTQIDSVLVQTYPQSHPGGSLGFTFEQGGCKVVYGTDNEIDEQLLNAAEVNADASTPRQFPPSLLEMVRDADLMVADAQYDDAEYSKRLGWGHARASTVVDLALAAGIKQVALFHHDPMQSDDDIEHKVAVCRARVANARSASRPVVFAAREGMELKICR
jgi:phosphoribosyl 1,2-cyclic phosphodiesterase